MEFKLLASSSSPNQNGKSPECDFDEHGINLKLSLATPSSVDLNLCLQPTSVTVRSCQVCQCTKTPFWRAGPNGSKTLCNACGLQYRKFEQRRKAFLAEGVPMWSDKEIDYEFAKLIGENPDPVYFVGGNSQGDN